MRTKTMKAGKEEKQDSEGEGMDWEQKEGTAQPQQMSITSCEVGYGWLINIFPNFLVGLKKNWKGKQNTTTSHRGGLTHHPHVC